MYRKIFALIFWVYFFNTTGAGAAVSSLEMAMEKTKAVVYIEAIDAAVLSEKPQGAFDPSTGQILIIQKIRKVAAAKNGNGIIIDPKGLIVTNTHTIEGANNVIITLYDGTKLKGNVLKTVENTDIAFIFASSPVPLPTMTFGNSSALEVGHEVFTVGHSKWMAGTVGGGHVIRLGIQNVDGNNHVTLFVTDFRSYHGDSGSPVLNARGEFVGMITAGATEGNATFSIASNIIASAYRTYVRSLQNATSSPTA